METRKYNKLSPEQLAEAEKLRDMYYITETASVSVPVRRDDSEKIKRFFGERGTTAGKMLSDMLTEILKTGRVLGEEEQNDA